MENHHALPVVCILYEDEVHQKCFVPENNKNYSSIYYYKQCKLNIIHVRKLEKLKEMMSFSSLNI